MSSHLQQLEEVSAQFVDGGQRLEAVLQLYASLQYQRPDTELARAVHQPPQLAHAHHQLTGFMEQLIGQLQIDGIVTADVPASELVSYSLQALGAANMASDAAAVSRLVRVVIAGLRPPDHIADGQTFTARIDSSKPAHVTTLAEGGPNLGGRSGAVAQPPTCLQNAAVRNTPEDRVDRLG